MDTQWYEITDELFAFAEALYEGGAFRDEDGDHRTNLFYMLRKPWKWTDEHTKWIAAGRPDTFHPEI